VHESTTHFVHTAKTGLYSLTEGREAAGEASSLSGLKYQSDPEYVAQWTTVCEGEDFTVKLKDGIDQMVHLTPVEQNQRAISLTTERKQSYLEQERSTVSDCKTERYGAKSSASEPPQVMVTTASPTGTLPKTKKKIVKKIVKVKKKIPVSAAAKEARERVKAGVAGLTTESESVVENSDLPRTVEKKEVKQVAEKSEVRQMTFEKKEVKQAVEKEIKVAEKDEGKQVVGEGIKQASKQDVKEQKGTDIEMPGVSPEKKATVETGKVNVTNKETMLEKGATLPRTRKVIKKVKKIVRRPAATPSTTSVTDISSSVTSDTPSREVTPSPLTGRKRMTRIVRKPRPVSDSSEDGFRTSDMSELLVRDGFIGDSISAMMRHRHITLSSSKVVVSRATSPTPPGANSGRGLQSWEKSPVERIKEEYEARETSPSPLSPTGKVSQNLEHLKSNREHIEEWWGKRTAGDGRPSLEQTFDGFTLMKWITDHNRSRRGEELSDTESNSHAHKLCETLLTAGLLQEVGKSASDEGYSCQHGCLLSYVYL
jgi:hypothetical protein